MKFVIYTSLLLLIASLLTAQESSKVLPESIEFEGNITIDNVNNLHGGKKTGSAVLGLLDLGLSYTPFKSQLSSTKIVASFLKTEGMLPSEQLLGDVQVASNIEGRTSRFFYQFYIKQQLGNFSFIAGMHDLNSEFVVSDYAGDFINSSFGIYPAMTLNLPLSIFPTTTFAGILSYESRNVDFVTGIYNFNYNFADETNFEHESHFYQGGFLGISELRYRWHRNAKLKGQYKIGAFWKHCNEHTQDQMLEACIANDNLGFYFTADQELFEIGDEGTIGLFAQMGVSPVERNYASEYFGLGISARNIFKIKAIEQVGLAVGEVELNQFTESKFANTNNREVVIEFTSTVRINKIFSIKPDIQYIISPSGVENNALAGIIRLSVDFN